MDTLNYSLSFENASYNYSDSSEAKTTLKKKSLHFKNWVNYIHQVKSLSCYAQNSNINTKIYSSFNKYLVNYVNNKSNKCISKTE